MAGKSYTASKSKTQGRNVWSISFRHPMRKDPQGRQGLKIRRGLKTTDELEADRLIEEMNQLLSDTSFHSILKKTEAEKKFSSVVVNAFYDEIESSTSDSWSVRNREMPLPDDEEYIKVLFVGTTGAGKTSLLRHLIGTHPQRDRFPSTSRNRTTIADTEVITGKFPTYKGVVTFFSEWEVYSKVHECVADASASYWEESSEEKIADRLLNHRDQRFRFSYILGSWKSTSLDEPEETEENWSYEGEPTEEIGMEDEEGEIIPSSEEQESLLEIIKSFVKRIVVIAKETKENVSKGLGENFDLLLGLDKEAAQEIYEEAILQHADFDDLVSDYMEEIQKRLDFIRYGTMKRNRSGWPECWVFETEDRNEFIKKIRPFASIYAKAFGRLLTPIVDGIRVYGEFYPNFSDPKDSKFILMDGQGLGHVFDSSSGISTKITKRFSETDVILLVDNSLQPMQEAPVSMIRAIASSGYQKKLAIAFTHFDRVQGINLPTHAHKKAHVINSVSNILKSLKDIVGHSAVRPLEKTLEDRCFMLGWLDKEITAKSKGPVKEMQRLTGFFKQSRLPEIPTEAKPEYDTASLIFAIQYAVVGFHNRWKAILGLGTLDGTYKAHWSSVKALNRRIALDIDNNEYGSLRPAADLIARLSDAISKYLDHPYKWSKPPVNGESDVVIQGIQQRVFNALHDLSEERLLQKPRLKWVNAYEHKGKGSTTLRANDIHFIYDEAAPIPGPIQDKSIEKYRSVKEFLDEIRRIVQEAIKMEGGEIEQ